MAAVVAIKIHLKQRKNVNNFAWEKQLKFQIRDTKIISFLAHSGHLSFDIIFVNFTFLYLLS